MKSVSAVSITLLLITTGVVSLSAPSKVPEAVPTSENALVAEQEIARSMQNNDGPGIARSLSDDWAVISTRGEVVEGPSTFPDGIKSGFLTRKAFEISEPRVRLYGNVAVITTKVKTSGTLKGKPFEVTERQTDVLLWKDGAWKSVLTHETKVDERLD